MDGFERFLNPHSATPPDFDIDFSWKGRNEVMGNLTTNPIFKQAGIFLAYNNFFGNYRLHFNQ